jgi:hypothetical protein
MEPSLSDTISTFRAISDQTHRIWAYYQAVTLAMLAYVWGGKDGPDASVVVFSIVIYAIFALGNGYLVANSQRNSLIVWKSIQAYVQRARSGINSEFEPNLSLGKPLGPGKVMVGHCAMSLAALCAMLARVLR